ncbi:hypothetical protein EIN_095050 [Entamoeba invadens IP1]|uniref:Rho-GAP domain-containing protein n=1 Tax=Entamoeba invadens IP1 TaxID=370355 RepID=A0A0A1U3E1_ENTIV|nr:hypothetical protein EIN_095050 [Entamoeba invadens IP1]ELP87268.1 hypothetical protein EIN_095050 [Entamoeba invadens IP1]|eukprot:XP_004254039.1 hypothetical protein EIN_095050 [Entamoeba invadens IP1]
MDKVTGMMDSIKAKTERAMNGEKTETPETEYVALHMKSIDDLETFFKKHKTYTNKIIDSFATIIEQLGNLAELDRTRLSTLPQNQKAKQAISVNFLLFSQGSFQVLKDELVRGYTCEVDAILCEIGDVKGTFQKNQRKTMDNLETLVTMKYQLGNLVEKRNRVMQDFQYKALNSFNNTVSMYFNGNGHLIEAAEEIEPTESEIQNIHLRGVSYVGKTVGEILDSEKRKHYELPKAIEEIIKIVRDNYLEREGVFRTAASLKEVDELYHRLSVSKLADFSCETLVSTLKRFVRELPGMLFCNSLAKDMLTTYRSRGTDEEKISALRKLFSGKWVPEEKIVLFKAICLLCSDISSRSDVNLMNNKNLSVCWTPTMFAVGNDDLSSYLEMMTFIIQEARPIFNDLKIGAPKHEYVMAPSVPYVPMSVPIPSPNSPRSCGSGDSPSSAKEDHSVFGGAREKVPTRDPMQRYQVKPQRPTTLVGNAFLLKRKVPKEPTNESFLLGEVN